jgi:hypothetical protein
MFQVRRHLSSSALALACMLAVGGFTAHADKKDEHDQDGKRPKKVFVIAMENHNWTQPGGPGTGNPQQIFMNPAAPFINSLTNGTSGFGDQVAYATNYINAAPGNHPSEPNYVWVEMGTPGSSVGTDADPFTAAPGCTPVTNNTTDQHLSAFLTKAGKSWKSYQEDVNVDLTSNTPLVMSAWTSPISSHSGHFTLPGMNAYNYSTQYNYAAKHNPQVFFTDTNGGCPATASTHYPPLQQLAVDLQHDTVADYNWITPNQYNDQHSSLSAGYGVFPNGDQASIAQGDNFLARVVPLIMASDAYEDGAVIVLWWDESEGGDTPAFTLPFFIISKEAHANVGGLPFAGSLTYSHSSFLRTMQKIFDVDPDDGFPFLGAAATANDLSALFRPGTIK